MSASHFGFYASVGIIFVLLGLWRVARGEPDALRRFSMLLGIVILAILAASLLGIVSLDGVEECLNDRMGRTRTRYFRCLFYVRWA